MPSWFDLGEGEPRLLAARCETCGTLVFPPRGGLCPNPTCDGDTFARQPLVRTGTVWSFCTNHYQPPAPYLSPDPFVPYTLAAVEIEADGLVVLGPWVAESGAAPEVGAAVELTVTSLTVEDEVEKMVWAWRPAGKAE